MSDCRHCGSDRRSEFGFCYYCGKDPASNPEPPVLVPKHLFDSLVEYALETKGDWHWKDGKPPQQQEFDQVVWHCEEAVAIRDAERQPMPELPEHTEELLLALHQEFYSGPKADADAFRILPKVVAVLKSCDAIPSTG